MTSVWQIAADLIDPPDGQFRYQPKQQMATDIAGRVDELLYGGAAGGGKSEWLIRYMIDQCERHDNNRVIIFRRVFPSLNRTVIPRARKILRGRARWNAQEKTFTFPNGSVLELGTMQYADDYIDYQGAEYGCVGFEEITEFLQVQVDELIARLRAPADGIRPHMVATTNPGGTGHRWVKKRWVKPDRDDINEGEEPPMPFEVWRPAATDEQPRPPLRAYVPATLRDNPKLLERDPSYLDRLLRNANRARRKALSTGDWDAIDALEGALWTAEDLDGGRVRPAYVEETIGVLRRVVAVDPSDGEEGGDAFGVSHCAKGMDGIGYVLGSWSWRASPAQMARKAVALYHEVGADAMVIEKNHGGKWMLEVFRQVDPYCNVKVVWATDNKRTRAEPVAALFERNDESLVRYRARMAGHHEGLENELTLTDFGPGVASPNELDAMVWAMTDLLVGDRGQQSGREIEDHRLRGRR